MLHELKEINWKLEAQYMGRHTVACKTVLEYQGWEISLKNFIVIQEDKFIVPKALNVEVN